MKKILRLILICLSILILPFNVVSAKAYDSSNNMVYLGGFPAGFTVQSRGAYVLGLCDVVTEEGIVSPSKIAGLRVGDVILSIDGIDVNNADEIESTVNDCNEKTFIVERKGSKEIINLTPAKDIGGKYKIGVFIRDGINGIGTITYIKNGRFASLGHPIINEDGNIIPVTSGNIFNCSITGVIKGDRGSAGELRGIFLKTNALGIIDKNAVNGVYGKCEECISDYIKLSEIEVAKAQMGDAQIYCTVDGKTPQYYDVSIIKTDSIGREDRNLVIKITDKSLLEKTGGIVQGMSGSPIVQNGKLVGAVTHVFLNDPTRGFGIFIQNMLDN